MTNYLIIFGYLIIVLVVGLYARRYSRSTSESYFLADRRLTPIVLFFTMMATNFSAFTVFGFAGAGYRIGYAFYPIMGVGTGFMGLAFFAIGRRVYLLGRTRGYITPADLITDRFQSRLLRILFFAVMAIFTLPYIAMQPIAAGFALQQLLGFHHFLGAAIITLFVVVYTFFGGMRGVAWTDIIQGSMKLVFLAVALVLIAQVHGGLSTANSLLYAQQGELFSRPGVGGAFPPLIWMSFMMLWFFCNPMFPQLFQRFYAAQKENALATTMILYPVVTGSLFLLPVTIGMLGHLSFPGLTGEATDAILPMLVTRYLPASLAAFVIASGLAALMSTMDSQLLTLSSMFSHDIYRPATGKQGYRAGKIFVAVLALAGLAIAYRPPATLFEIATQTFTGLAVLFPTVLATLYWRNATAKGAIASIVVGQVLVVCYYFDLLPRLGMLPVIPILVITTAVLILVSLLTTGKGTREYLQSLNQLTGKRSRRASLGWAACFLGLLFLANDFWAWGKGSPTLFGFPGWIWYFLGLNILLIIGYYLFIRYYWRPDR
ncbi:sodium:solute symporter family protein [Candidatus Acetothermia bacterium]|nr:sodium:solute symporter family protein [Candidatus Acetothermia bacterium]